MSYPARAEGLVNRISYLLKVISTSTAIDRLSIIWKSDLSDEIKCEFFQDVAVEVPLYDSTTWTLKKHLQKCLIGTTQGCCVLFWTSSGSNKTNKMTAIWPLTSHLTNHPKWTKHAGHGWRSKDEVISDVHLWTSKYGLTSIGRPAKNNICPLSGVLRN